MELRNTFRTVVAGGLLTLAAAAVPAHADNNPLGATAACGPDVPGIGAGSPQAVVGALYEILSGPAGSKKDWARMHSLFAPGALVTPTWHGAAAFLAAPQTPQQFSALNERLLGHRDFFERETSSQVLLFGHMAHVWSGFETSTSAGGPPRARGINSFQLLNDGRRWCILSATWDLETPAHPVPPQLAQSGK